MAIAASLLLAAGAGMAIWRAAPDGLHALTAGHGAVLVLWDVATGAEIRRFEGHTASIHYVAFAPDGRHALSCSKDGTIRLWDMGTGDCVQIFTGHTDLVGGAVFSADGRYILSGSFDKTVRLWRLPKLQGHPANQVIKAAPGKFVGPRLADGPILGEVRRFAGHELAVNRVAVSHDGSRVLSASMDRTVRVWDVATGTELRRFLGHTDKVEGIAFSPDDRRAVSGGWDKVVRLWEAASGKQILALKGHTEPIRGVAFSPDGHQAVSCSEDRTAKLWDLESGQPMRVFEGHTDGINSAAFSPDGRQVRTTGWDRTIRLWDVATGQELRVFQGHTDKVAFAVFAPDGQTALSLGLDGLAKLWDVKSGKLLRTYKEHTSPIWTVAFSPNGKQILTGGADTDRTLRLWDVESEHSSHVFQAPGGVAGLVFLPSGRQALSGSWDKELHLWQMPQQTSTAVAPPVNPKHPRVEHPEAIEARIEIPADTYWPKWRARQRAELAALPAPPQPPDGPGPPIDRFLAANWAEHHITPPALVDDRTFARRVYLDAIGLLPSVEELDRFVRDPNPEKRQQLVERLLANQPAYAEHWITFWNDLLRNDEQSLIDNLREPITGWLYQALLENKPIDLFVAELLNPSQNGPHGYLKGILWRGRVNASQMPPVQAAQNVAQVFLATSIKCASCHDSFINKWKLKQAYSLASFFTPQNLEMHRCDKPTGKIAAPAFLFAGLGSIAPDASQDIRHQAVALMVTRPKNPRFARTIVNRYWKRLLGRGLFEPADDFDSQPPNSALLDWLAYDLMSHDYDVKYTLRSILLSRVYQLPVAKTGPTTGKELPPLDGPTERRLTSEQFLDAMAQVTGSWPQAEVMKVAVTNPHLRAWRIRKPDSLATALGRPNREQVCTERNQDSTVLQALELVNGQALTSRLRDGARTLLRSELGREPEKGRVVQTVYLRALGRLPTKDELTLATPLVGTAQSPLDSRQENWEDLLWMLFMNPEFQFVR